MFGKGSKIYSIVTGRCPKCQEDHMYVNNNPYVISLTMAMHDHCRNCGLKYKVEPNFFFGAMYVSYGLAVVAGILTFLFAQFVFDTGLLNAFIAIFGALVLLMPLITRISRNIYINLFINYSKTAGQTNAEL
ncbi:MAG TPA: DUF983 domain-containing protein [Flavobacterium sp.]|jgi:uncharacterized protein (DUF983 family)